MLLAIASGHAAFDGTITANHVVSINSLEKHKWCFNFNTLLTAVAKANSLHKPNEP